MADLAKKLSRPSPQGKQAHERRPEELLEPAKEVGRTQRVPATFAQQRLWFMERLQPGNLAYLVAWNLRLTGDLHVEALGRTINEMVRRHKVFRTSFAEADGDVFQVIVSSLNIPLPVIDLSGEPDSEEAAKRAMLEETQRPVDLENGPILRASLLRLNEREHILLLTLHHIIFDGSSRALFIREFSAIYDAFREGKPSPLPEPKIQYADFAVWQRRSLQGKRYQKLLDYWKKQLADAPAVLALPTDRARPAVETFRGATKSFELPAKLSAELTALSRQRGASLFMVLMAAFQTLLAKYCAQDDIVVGIPVAGRTRTEFEGLLGLFANQLVLRLRFNDDPTFNELIEQMKNVSFDAFEHQEMPLDRLVQELNPDRSLSHNPLFQVVLSLRNYRRQEMELAGLDKVEFTATAGEASKFDLSVFITENPDHISGWIEYNVDLFDEGTIDRMVEHYGVLLEAVAEDAGRRVSTLSLLTAAEKHRVLVDFNQTAFDRPVQPIHEGIEAQVERTPDSVALTFGSAVWSYRELNRRANCLAHYLQELGAKRGSIVAICLDRSPELVAGMLAILKTGAAYLPLDPIYPADRVATVLSDAQVTLAVTQQSLANVFALSTARLIQVDTEAALITAEEDANLCVPVHPDDLAYVLFTSGSTGRPKGCQLEHRNLSHYLGWACDFYSTDPEEGNFPLFSSISFDLTVTSLFLPLLRGRSLHVLPQDADIADILTRAFTSSAIDAVKLTPAHVSLLKDLELERSSVRFAIVGGEAFTPEQAAILWSL